MQAHIGYKMMVKGIGVLAWGRDELEEATGAMRRWTPTKELFNLRDCSIWPTSRHDSK
jgi:hypothetical protein